jgi:hypothetical protein
MQSTSRLKYLNVGDRSNKRLSRKEKKKTLEPFRVLVRGADHLREIDNDRLTVVSTDEDIELVEIAMDQASARKLDDEVHQRGEQLFGGRDVGYLASMLRDVGSKKKKKKKGGSGGRTMDRRLCIP